MNIPYWTRNNRIVRNRSVNRTFDEILHMPPDEFNQWVDDDVRAFVLTVWIENGSPPLVGKSKEQIEDEFLEIRDYDASRLRRTDEKDGKRNVLLAPTNLGSSINQFFPSMWKTKIDGHSIYDEFADNFRFRRSARLKYYRQFRRDSFHRYSRAIKRDSQDDKDFMPAATGAEWIEKFSVYSNDEGLDFWLCDNQPSGSSYTKINPNDFLWVNEREIRQGLRKGYLSRRRHLTNVQELEDGKRYWIRLYEKATRIFPIGFAAFREGHQAAVNFPPLVATFLVDRYTADFMDQEVVTVYDPCAGWAGRLIGALALDDRRIRYIGNDPNTDNFLPELRRTRYEYLAKMFLDSVGNPNGHSVVIFRQGSEDIHENEDFKKYKGTVDFVFTSTPYHKKEIYKDEPTQSAIRFPDYDDWRDGFLKPTLQTCVAWLRPGGYLAWNISDVKLGKDEYVPLEDDSKKILKELGMEDCGFWRMVLSGMPGANRIDEDGELTTKNSCVLNGKKRKMEPIFIFRKPV